MLGKQMQKLEKYFCSRQKAYFLLPVLPVKVLMEREKPSDERELLTYLLTYLVT